MPRQSPKAWLACANWPKKRKGAAHGQGIFLLNQDAYQKIYGPAEQAAIARAVEFYAPPQTAQSVQADPAILHDAEMIFSGWGMPIMDQAFLAAAPNLKIVFYGAGSIKYCTTDTFWQRGIPITSSYAANGVPVAISKQTRAYAPRLPIAGA